MRILLSGLTLIGGMIMAGSAVAQGTPSVRENIDQVKVLNDFAANILKAHTQRIERLETRVETRTGGYARLPNFYREVTHYDAATGRLLGRVQWEQARKDALHSVEFYVYDARGRVKVDYLAQYLTDFRNAPVQALVNIHHHDGELSAFRQFDALGDRLFERCEGSHFGEKVDVYLDDIEIPPPPSRVSEEVYLACFGILPKTPDAYLDPLAVLEAESRAGAAGAAPAVIGGAGANAYDEMERRIETLTRDIATTPKDAALYVERGEARFLLREFDDAIADFTRALALDENRDRAYFGRGMARGRSGDLVGGIADLTVFLDHNPNSSLGYTKRGVRHIWNNNLQLAERDLRTAIAIDPDNAEAHDDLGVVLAQTNRHEEAARHFERSRTIEPSYQKAHHNLAMVYYIGGNMARALDTVDGALRLSPDARDSLMLKALILEALGHTEDANAIRVRAEFLPEANWSERSGLR